MLDRRCEQSLASRARHVDTVAQLYRKGLVNPGQVDRVAIALARLLDDGVLLTQIKRVIIIGIVALAAGERVCTRPANEHVVAGQTGQGIDAAVAGQPVILGSARDAVGAAVANEIVAGISRQHPAGAFASGNAMDIRNATDRQC